MARAGLGKFEQRFGVCEGASTTYFQGRDWAHAIDLSDQAGYLATKLP